MVDPIPSCSFSASCIECVIRYGFQPKIDTLARNEKALSPLSSPREALVAFLRFHSFSILSQLQFSRIKFEQAGIPSFYAGKFSLKAERGFQVSLSSKPSSRSTLDEAVLSESIQIQ
jgi:hypothetical protein